MYTCEEVGTTVEIAQGLEASSMWSPPSQLSTEPCDADDLLERISRPTMWPLNLRLSKDGKVPSIDELGVEVLEGNWTAEASLAFVLTHAESRIFTMTRRKGNSSRDSTQQTHTSSEGTARESSHRPRSRVNRFLEKVKSGVNNDSPIPPNANHERASLTSAAPSRVQVEAEAQSALQDTREAAEGIHSLSGHATTVVSLVQDAQEDLDAADKFQETYLKPLRIFDAVIGEIADVHPYAKMALGVLSCAAKIILVQVNRDKAVRELLE
ncbi:hypothetical protein DFJ58DRAFT_917992, partial [Suillus subalutaceus]|uniref:uncharacterized protein n=1 Tax=Suillus subalutaceus TaxID=48586 RepID=UPI001B878A77